MHVCVADPSSRSTAPPRHTLEVNQAYQFYGLNVLGWLQSLICRSTLSLVLSAVTCHVCFANLMERVNFCLTNITGNVLLPLLLLNAQLCTKKVRGIKNVNIN